MLKVTDIIHMRQNGRGYRVWKVTGVRLGAQYQESTYALKPLDVSEHESIHVPHVMMHALLMSGIVRLA